MFNGTAISTGEFRRKYDFSSKQQFTIDPPYGKTISSASPAINLKLQLASSSPAPRKAATRACLAKTDSAQSCSSLSPSSSSSNFPSSSRNNSSSMEPASRQKLRNATIEPKYFSPILKARADLESKRSTPLSYKSRSERNLVNDMNPKLDELNHASRVKDGHGQRFHNKSTLRSDPKVPHQMYDEESDDLKLDEIDYSCDDYKQLVLHYKNLCKSYKRQLVDSHQTIQGLHSTIQQLENRNYIQKKQKSGSDLVKLESAENGGLSTNMALDKLSTYFDKLNEYIASESSSDDDSGCSNLNSPPPPLADKYGHPAAIDRLEMMTNTLRSVLKEKRESKVFTKSFLKMAYLVNPESKLVASSMKNYEKISLAKLTQIASETTEHLMSSNNLANYTCKCGSGEPRASDSLQLCVQQSGHHNLHKPSTEYMARCLDMFQDLFNVQCFEGIPNKLNDICFKYGQLLNFKQAIQDIIDPDQNYSMEKLVGAVQSIHEQLNGQLEENLKKYLNITNLDKVVDRFKVYNEYFPLFNILLEEVMKTLEISRLDQIMPSIRALKILATPTL